MFEEKVNQKDKCMIKSLVEGETLNHLQLSSNLDLYITTNK